MAAMNLDRAERQRRAFEVNDFTSLSQKYNKNDTATGRALLLTEWKRKRMENWKQTFGSLPSAPPVHQIIPDESVLLKGMEIRPDNPIGAGIFSRIFPARLQPSSRSNKIDAAVKILRKSDFMTQYQIKDCDRQMRILLQLNHSHIIRVYDVYEIRNADKFLIFMQRAKMGSLDAAVKRNGPVFESPLAKKWTRDIIFAIDYLHNLGIAHRRICPENILIQSPNHAAKLSMPIALAEVRADSKNAGIVRNDFGSPETMFGPVFDAFPADIWSLGCTVYFMLTTTVPFPDYSRMDVLKQQLRDQSWRKADNLSTEAADFLSNMLRGTVSKRMTTAELLPTPWIQSLTPQTADN